MLIFRFEAILVGAEKLVLEMIKVLKMSHI